MKTSYWLLGGIAFLGLLALLFGGGLLALVDPESGREIVETSTDGYLFVGSIPMVGNVCLDDERCRVQRVTGSTVDLGRIAAFQRIVGSTSECRSVNTDMRACVGVDISANKRTVVVLDYEAKNSDTDQFATVRADWDLGKQECTLRRSSCDVQGTVILEYTYNDLLGKYEAKDNLGHSRLVDPDYVPCVRAESSANGVCGNPDALVSWTLARVETEAFAAGDEVPPSDDDSAGDGSEDAGGDEEPDEENPAAVELAKREGFWQRFWEWVKKIFGGG